MHKSALRYILLAALFMALMVGSTAAQTKRLAIIPFTVNAEKDLSYLAQGAADMMGSRIAASTDVTPLDMATVRAGARDLARPLSRNAVADFGKQLNADYVLYGSITILGGHVSIDANVIDVSGNTSPAAFFRQADSMAGVIPAVNDIAGEIGKRVFSASPLRAAEVTGGAPVDAPVDAPGDASGNASGNASATLQATAAPPVPSPYVHPEKLLDQNGLPDGQTPAPQTSRSAPTMPSGPQDGPTSGSPFVVTGKAAQDRGFWKSRDFDREFSGMAVGDVDGDGMNETILITNDYLCVRRMESGRFYMLAEREGPGYERQLAVDVADTDGNGRAEIFVTTINENNRRLCSFVCELSGRSIAMIAENQPWYFRTKGNGVIAGQKKGMSEDVFLPGIYRLERSGADYVQTEQISIPIDGVSVYDYATGRLLDNGEEQFVVMDENDRLKVYSKTGDIRWKSQDRFGGSETFVTVKEDSDNEIGERRYLPPRVFVTDLENDGQNEVLTVANDAVSGRLFNRFRQYSGVKVVCLGWNGLGLSEMWHTRQISGYASDFSLADIDNDGKNEVALVVVSARKAALSAPRSSVISYDLEGAL